MALFIDINDSNINDTIASGTVLLDFRADWCAPCKSLDPILDDLAHKYSDSVTFAKLDVDLQPQIARKFGVMSIPTVNIFKNGNLEQSFVGVQPLDVYEAALLL